MTEIKITPQTYIDMNKEFEEDGTPFTIAVPTQEAIDEWKSKPPQPYQEPPHIDMVAEMWKKHREQEESEQSAKSISSFMNKYIPIDDPKQGD
jgi:hypothetical protein